MEIDLSLTFACCGCQLAITTDLKCRGVGGADPAAGGLASVNIPCPGCPAVNQVVFETTGRVRDVRPFAPAQAIPEPSVN